MTYLKSISGIRCAPLPPVSGVKSNRAKSRLSLAIRDCTSSLVRGDSVETGLDQWTQPIQCKTSKMSYPQHHCLESTRAHDANLHTSIVSNSPILQVHSYPGLIYKPLSSFSLPSTPFRASLSARSISLSPVHLDAYLSPTCIQ